MDEFDEIIEVSFTDREIATLNMRALTFEEWKAMVEGNGIEFEP
jgi:hypothetical protein